MHKHLLLRKSEVGGLANFLEFISKSLEKPQVQLPMAVLWLLVGLLNGAGSTPHPQSTPKEPAWLPGQPGNVLPPALTQVPPEVTCTGATLHMARGPNPLEYSDISTGASGASAAMVEAW